MITGRTVTREFISLLMSVTQCLEDLRLPRQVQGWTERRPWRPPLKAGKRVLRKQPSFAVPWHIPLEPWHIPLEPWHDLLWACCANSPRSQARTWKMPGWAKCTRDALYRAAPWGRQAAHFTPKFLRLPSSPWGLQAAHFAACVDAASVNVCPCHVISATPRSVMTRLATCRNCGAKHVWLHRGTATKNLLSLQHGPFAFRGS